MKPKFFGKLRLEYLNGTEWKLINPNGKDQFGFRLADGTKIIPEDGSITDFASTPKFFRRIFPSTGDKRKKRYGKSAVIHDDLYKSGKLGKKESDYIFLLGMQVSNVSRHVRFAMYQAVNWFGFFAWNKHRKRQRQKKSVDS